MSVGVVFSSFRIVVVCLLLLIVATPCFAINVLLTWDPNTENDLLGYKVYYKIGSSPAPPFDGVGAPEGASPLVIATQTSQTLTNLDPAITYSFAVSAYNTPDSVSEGPLSNVVQLLDSVPPVITSFGMPSTSNSLTVPITFIATDKMGVTGYLLNESSTTPDPDDGDWKPLSPTSFSWNSPGTKTLYAWAKDAAGNVSAVAHATTVIDVKRFANDGTVTLADVLLTLRFALKLENPSPDQLYRADVAPLDMTTTPHTPMPDGVLDMNDVALVLRASVGLPW